MSWFNEFLGSLAGIALQGLLAAAVLDFAFGVLAALRDGSFTWTAIAAWLRKHMAGRVGPIAVLLVAAHFTGNAALVTAAILAAGTYSAETFASLMDSLGTIRKPEAPPLALEETNTGFEVTVPNPVPTD